MLFRSVSAENAINNWIGEEDSGAVKGEDKGEETSENAINNWIGEEDSGAVKGEDKGEETSENAINNWIGEEDSGAVFSAVSARPFLAPWVELKYSRTVRPSLKLEVIGVSIISPVGFAIKPLIPASCFN